MALRKVKVKARELRDVDVQFVSLVDRGANRVPFRLQKRDPSKGGDDVFNFQVPFRKSTPEASLVAVAIDPTLDAEAALAAVSEIVDVPEGAVFETAENAQVLPLIEDFDAAKATFCKFDERRGVYLAGAGQVLKAASMSFEDNLGASQFLPGLHMATDALFGTVMATIDGAASKEQAVTAIKAAAEQFTGVVTMLADKIPLDVFKLERALAKIGAKAAPVEKTEKVEAKPAGEPEKAPEPEKVEAKKDDPAQAAAAPDLAGLLKGLGEQVAAIGAQVKGLSEQVTTVAKDAGEAKALAKKAERVSQAAGGIAPGDPAPNGKTPVRKRGVPLLDTAVTPTK